MKIKQLGRRFVPLFAAFFCVGTAFAQISVSGVVNDAAGEPIIGGSVLELGTTNGTITDFDGNFALTVANGAKLQISYMGYQTQEVEVKNGATLNITLLEDQKALDEVVVIGYGVVKKNDATGSVTAIKPDQMNKGLNTTAQDMLQGKIAGVSVTTGGGTPGSGATIRIRGGSSLSASNDPLIVIDGLAMDNNGVQGVANPLSLVNPNDIETFTVLKDASATAIYGSRASNGVIIITTKKGSAGSAPKVSYEGNVSVGTLLQTMDVLSGDEIRAYAKEVGHKETKTMYLGPHNTDWQSLIYRPAPATDHTISVTGGAKNMPYRASVGYTYQDGIIKTSNMQRVTAAINLNPSFLDKHLTFNLNAKGMYIQNRFADGGVVGSAMSFDPTMPVRGGLNDAETEQLNRLFGGYYQRTSAASYGDDKWERTNNPNTAANPLASLEQKDDRSKAGQFVGNLEVDYKIHGFEDLRLHANFGADYSFGRQKTEVSPFSTSNHYFGWNGFTEKMKYNLQFNCYAQYYKDFNENHHFDAMIGYEWQHFYNEGRNEGKGVYQLTHPTKGGSDFNVYKDEWISENYLVSFFGRVNYTALNRYMITATLRGDGSSRFAPKHRWGLFPSVALGWKIKEEAFLKDVYWLSDLKLRLGYGITGQQEIGQGDYPYLPVFSISKDYAYYPVGGEGMDNKFIVRDDEGNPLKDSDGNLYYYSYRPGAYNVNLTWEKTTTYNAGLDFGFLRNRISGSFDFYYRDTKDLINVVDIPAGQNFRNRLVSNVGSLRNMGVEVALNAVAVDTKNFKWDLGVNVTWNDNKITQLSASDSEDYYIPTGGIGSGTGNTIQAHKVGYAASSFYVYETKRYADGVYVIDRNSDGVINAADKYFYKDPNADALIGFQTKFQFYGFDLGLSFRASIGNYVYNDVQASQLQFVQPGKFYQDQNGGYHGLIRSAYDAYVVDGMKPDKLYYGSYEKVEGKKTDEWYLADYFIQNASFLRCDNITLGYSINKEKIKARVYATVQNPFIITAYKGLDPEVFGGIDSNIYPRCMTTLVGVSLQF